MAQAEAMRARALERLAPATAILAPAIAMAQDAFAVALPYLTKAFHYGFIPFVLLLGMRSGPAAERPRLTDLLTPF